MQVLKTPEAQSWVSESSIFGDDDSGCSHPARGMENEARYCRGRLALENAKVRGLKSATPSSLGEVLSGESNLLPGQISKDIIKGLSLPLPAFVLTPVNLLGLILFDLDVLFCPGLPCPNETI